MLEWTLIIIVQTGIHGIAIDHIPMGSESACNMVAAEIVKTPNVGAGARQFAYCIPTGPTPQSGNG